MKTATEKTDIILDAIGLIGDDLIAEASGTLGIIPVSSKTKLNLMVIRRLLAATICLMLISALTPLSVYLYNNYFSQTIGNPSDTTGAPVSEAETSEAVSESTNTNETEEPKETEKPDDTTDGIKAEVTLPNGIVLQYIDNGVVEPFYNIAACSSEATDELIIPYEFEGIPVAGIDRDALSQCHARKIIFPSSITIFNTQEFTDDVKRIEIDCNAELVLPDEAFSFTKLEEVVFTGELQFIPNWIFYKCESLKSVRLPDGVLNIGRYAFFGCSALSEINFPESLKIIQENAFCGCSSIESIILPDGIETLKEFAFSGCSAAKEIHIPASITKLESSLFAGHGCESISIPEGVTFIDSDALRGDNLKEILLPSTITEFNQNFIHDHTCPLKRIYYNGTKAEYTAKFIHEYASYLISYTVYCTDGEIEIVKNS